MFMFSHTFPVRWGFTFNMFWESYTFSTYPKYFKVPDDMNWFLGSKLQDDYTMTFVIFMIMWQMEERENLNSVFKSSFCSLHIIFC